MSATRLEIELYLQDMADSMARDGLSAGAIVMGLQEEFMDELHGPDLDINDWMSFISNAAKTAAGPGDLDEFSIPGIPDCPKIKESFRISRNRLRQIIREEADIIINYARAEELDPREEAWSGGENLTLPLDHSKAVKAPPVHAEPESLPDADPVLHKEGSQELQIYYTTTDRGFACVLPSRIYEQYYDTYVEGRLGKAQRILENHLDRRYPLWLDYEWK